MIPIVRFPPEGRRSHQNIEQELHDDANDGDGYQSSADHLSSPVIPVI
jgi:hypothetical protein